MRHPRPFARRLLRAAALGLLCFVFNNRRFIPMQQTTLAFTLALCALSISIPTDAFPAKPEQVLPGIVAQTILDQHLKEVENTRVSEIRKLRDDFEKVQRDLNAAKENAKQEADKAKEVISIARLMTEDAKKSVEWGVSLGAWISGSIIGIMTLIGALVIYKTSHDAKEAKNEAKSILTEAKSESKEIFSEVRISADTALTDIKEKIGSAERLLNDLKDTVTKAEAEYRRLSISHQKSQNPKKPMDQSDIMAAEEIASQNEDLLAKHRAEALLAQNKKEWAKALQAWEEVLKIDPESTQALFGRAFSMTHLSDIETDIDKKASLLRDAICSYENASSKDPNEYWAINNWGGALGSLATITPDPVKREEILELACLKFADAVNIQKNFPEAIYNWGHALSCLAEPEITTNPTDRKALLDLALQKCAEANSFKADDCETLNCWGGILCKLYHNAKESGDESGLNEYLYQATEQYTRAEHLERGAAAYNLACSASLLGQEELCRKWLERAKEHNKLPSHDHLQTDKDLDPIRDRPWFTTFLKELPSKEHPGWPSTADINSKT